MSEERQGSIEESENILKAGTGINLDAPGALKQLSERIKQDIDAYCVATYTGKHRTHLGASIIGQECTRASWYTFRWVFYKQHTGRMLRLFQRGHREEAVFIEYLRGASFQVWEIAEDGEQHKITGAWRHFGGSLDGGAKFPELYNIDEPILTEFKTQATGSKFDAHTKKGMRLTKPQHFAQMCVYGRKFGLQYGLYMVVNKNDDDLYIEVVKLDWKFGAELEDKAERIILSKEAPQKVAMTPTYVTCKYCDFVEQCHNGAKAEINCRSCRAALPAANGQWVCEVYNSIIPAEYVPTGCERWNSII